MKRNLAFSIALMAGTALATPAFAQDQNVDILSSWNYDPLYQEGRSVEWMIDNTDLFGPTGDEIGNVENVVFADDGQAVALIAEVGGFWDIGDTHVSIPWDQVEFGVGNESMSVPVTEENVGDYYYKADSFISEGEVGVTQEVDDDLATGTGLFKATDLIGDYGFTNDNTIYGYVNDLLVGQNGQIEAVVVDATGYGRPGYYAYPYDGTVNPYAPGYGLQYGADQLGQIENFDYDQLQSGA